MFGRKSKSQPVPPTIPESIARARLAVLINRAADAQVDFTNTDAPRMRLSALLDETLASLATAQADVNGVKAAEIQDIKAWVACGDDSSPAPRTSELREAEKGMADAHDRVAYVQAALEEAKQRSANAKELLDVATLDRGEASYDVLMESINETALQYLKVLEQAADLASEIEGAHELIRARFSDLPPKDGRVRSLRMLHPGYRARITSPTWMLPSLPFNGAPISIEVKAPEITAAAGRWSEFFDRLTLDSAATPISQN